MFFPIPPYIMLKGYSAMCFWEFVNVCLDHIRIQGYDGDGYDDYGDDDGEVIQGMRM